MKSILQAFLLVLVVYVSINLFQRSYGPIPSISGPEATPRPSSVPEAPRATPEAIETTTPTPSPLAESPKPTPRPSPKPVKPILPPALGTGTPAPLPVMVPVATPEPISDGELYARISGTAVQIFCTAPDKLYSASGVIVNSGGLILTNAHVADIVKNVGETNCTARHGNPAWEFAGVRLVFTPDTAPKIPETTVSQRDFAFLRLDAPRESFQAAPIHLLLAAEGDSFYTLGYPSEFLQSIAAFSNSNLVFSVLRVDNYADFDGDLTTIEGYISKGGLALQQGSSGTALFTKEGRVAGLIFATTKGTTTADREGIALSMPYLDRILKLETGKGLLDFIGSH